MQNTMLNCRTVSIVRDLKTEKRKGANGEFESKDILFRIAVNRDYKVTRTDENGKTTEDYPTDFWLAKCTGKVAQIFADNCCHKKADGKLQSRHLLLSGNFETYKKVKELKTNVDVEIGGEECTIEDVLVSYETYETIFIVDGIAFLDSNPVKTTTESAGTIKKTVYKATPKKNGTTTTSKNKTSAKPTTTVEDDEDEEIEPTQESQAEPMNSPVVGDNFKVTGEDCPFM